MEASPCVLIRRENKGLNTNRGFKHSCTRTTDLWHGRYGLKGRRENKQDGMKDQSLSSTRPYFPNGINKNFLSVTHFTE